MVQRGGNANLYGEDTATRLSKRGRAWGIAADGGVYSTGHWQDLRCNDGRRLAAAWRKIEGRIGGQAALGAHFSRGGSE